MEIYPSIASGNCLAYGNELGRINTWPNLHIDIEDGNFTPNITFGMKTVSAICSTSKARNKQVHLMTTNPFDYLEGLYGFGVSEVIAHIEALPDPENFINRCRTLKMAVGLAIKPRTDFSLINPYIDRIDSILFLTSEPVGKTEEFFPPAFDRVLHLISSIPKNVRVIADGGLNEPRLKILAEKGLDCVVLGRLVFSANDPLKKMNELYKCL